jgi:hypothetical protein
MPNNQAAPSQLGLVQLNPWPLTRTRVSHILDGLNRHSVDISVWLEEAKPWILNRPWVPTGQWCKQFPRFRLVEKGSEPLTGLGPMSAYVGTLITT